MASVATVYSKALYNIAKEEKALDKVAVELKEFLTLCRVSGDLRKVLYSSLFDANTRAAVAEEVATKIGAQPLTKKFLSLLARKNRISSIAVILFEFGKIRDREQGVVKGQMQSAVDLSASEVEDLTQSLTKSVGKRVELSIERDETLLGGFIVHVDGKTFDSSLRTQLRILKEICTA